VTVVIEHRRVVIHQIVYIADASAKIDVDRVDAGIDDGDVHAADTTE